MDIFATAAPYLKDPMVLVGFVVFLAFLTARPLLKSRLIRPVSNSSGFRILRLTLRHGFLLGLLVMATGGYLKYLEPGASTAARVARSEASDIPVEVDFGFVELDPGRPTAVPSYKNGGTMLLHAGEEFEFRVVADGPIPPIELRAGDRVQLLPGSDGKVKIIGPLNQPLPAVLLASGSPRISLPGAAPPRIAVKVRVLGVARRK